MQRTALALLLVMTACDAEAQPACDDAAGASETGIVSTTDGGGSESTTGPGETKPLCMHLRSCYANDCQDQISSYARCEQSHGLVPCNFDDGNDELGADATSLAHAAAITCAIDQCGGFDPVAFERVRLEYVDPNYASGAFSDFYVAYAAALLQRCEFGSPCTVDEDCGEVQACSYNTIAMAYVCQDL